MPRRKKKPEIVNEAEIEKIRKSLTKTNIKLKKIALTEKQKQLLQIIFDNDSKIIFISGPCGHKQDIRGHIRCSTTLQYEQ